MPSEDDYGNAGFAFTSTALIDTLHPDPIICIECEDPARGVHAKGLCTVCYYRAKRTASR